MWFLTAYSIFSDIDECANATDTCSPFAVCNNTMGEFNCSCLEGFEGDGFNCTGKYFGIKCTVQYCPSLCMTINYEQEIDDLNKMLFTVLNRTILDVRSILRLPL